MIEDAAQGVMASYKGKALGSIGDYGCYSFHETKNYSMGEGGALLIRDREHVERAEIIREKGTDRSKYFRGQVDKYRWQEFGSSYLPSELNVAYLYAQLEMADQINEARLARWNEYYKLLTPLSQAGKIELPVVPEGCVHNAHMFYIKTADEHERQELINYCLLYTSGQQYVNPEISLLQIYRTAAGSDGAQADAGRQKYASADFYGGSGYADDAAYDRRAS